MVRNDEPSPQFPEQAAGKKTATKPEILDTWKQQIMGAWNALVDLENKRDPRPEHLEYLFEFRKLLDYALDCLGDEETPQQRRLIYAIKRTLPSVEERRNPTAYKVREHLANLAMLTDKLTGLYEKGESGSDKEYTDLQDFCMLCLHNLGPLSDSDMSV